MQYLFIDTRVGSGTEPMALKAVRKRRFTCTNTIMRSAWPVNKMLENNTHNGLVTSVSTLDAMIPLVLYIEKLNSNLS